MVVARRLVVLWLEGVARRGSDYWWWLSSDGVRKKGKGKGSTVERKEGRREEKRRERGRRGCVAGCEGVWWSRENEQIWREFVGWGLRQGGLGWFKRRGKGEGVVWRVGLMGKDGGRRRGRE
ncbi:hypothetical protein GOBAR_AA24677 [Gossypium barbadense]|uniref:Uncharacterized protein n=1 Tax=Gossypium barbadense TaxID=3634 RepID=A0A2P5WY32_GOSBA|nr:hypothetical protein GOBAR_AA24677 [Gossypium barbadense]